MNRYSIYSKKIILYGAATIGKKAFYTFVDNGMDVVGFIDKRNDEIDSFLNRPVWGISDGFIKGLDKNEYVIYISVKNVFEHTNIAVMLYDNGFRNIIFRPYEIVNGGVSSTNDVLLELYDLYSDIEDGVLSDRLERIPEYTGFSNYHASDAGIIVDNDEIVAFLPIEAIHTDDKHTKWSDIPIMALLPHIDLFRFLEGESEYSPDRYMEYCIEAASNSEEISITEAWKGNVIRNRSMIYSRMMHSMELNPDFFVKNAVRVTYNKDNHSFNLNSGKHRAALFAALRRKFIPARLSKEEYRQYLQEDNANEIIAYLNENKISETNAPISNPLLYDLPCKNSEFFYGFLYWFIYRLAERAAKDKGEINFKDFKIICIGLDDCSFLENAFISMGLSVFTLCGADNPVEIKIKNLYGNTADKWQGSSVDMAIIDASGTAIDESVIICLSGKASEIIMISDNERYKEILTDKYTFSHAETRMVKDGSIVEIGVFQLL